jgi:hypothetical protein
MAIDLTAISGPTDDELNAIDAEMPLVKAWMDLDWIEIHFATTTRDLTDLDVRRWRKAAARVATEARRFYDRPAGTRRLAAA